MNDWIKVTDYCPIVGYYAVLCADGVERTSYYCWDDEEDGECSNWSITQNEGHEVVAWRRIPGEKYDIGSARPRASFP